MSLQLELKISDLIGKIDLLVIEVNKCKEGMDFMNRSFEDMRKDLNLVNSNHTLLLEENKTIKQEVGDLRREVDFLKRSMGNIEKEKPLQGIEISMVPKVEGENLKDLIVNLAKTSDYPLKEEEIQNVFRRKGKTNDKIGDIVLTMKTKEVRNAFLKCIKKKKLQVKDLGFKGLKGNIYARELLSSFGKEIYFGALAFKKENSWKYLWINDGNVLLREKDGGRYYVIRRLDDLKTLK